MPSVRTVADVFVIESLDPDDEGNGRLEGSSISHLLRLHGKNPKYRYVRTKKDFVRAIKEFGASNYRYLHISAHGDENGLCTTNLDDLSYIELGALLKGHLRGRRLFISACSVVHFKMALPPITLAKAFSVVGPEEDIEFHDAVVMWNLIYHLLLKKNTKAVSGGALKEVLNNVQSVLGVKLAYYRRSKSAKTGLAKVKLGK